MASLTTRTERNVDKEQTSHLPVASREVLERSGRAFQGGWVGTFCQQSQVGFYHRRVPQHLHPFGGLGQSRDWPDSIPLKDKRHTLSEKEENEI